jgi:hypothetical protein
MRARDVGGVVVGVLVFAGSLGSGGAWAQSQPKLPETLPVPKTAPPGAAAQASPATDASKTTPAESPSSAPGGRRDPFDPLVKKAGPGDDKRLQEIGGLRLVGAIWDPRSPGAVRALVETPDGLGYYLRVNDQKFGGTVVAVERDRVQFSVQEEVPGGANRTRTIELRMAKPEGQQ